MDDAEGRCTCVRVCAIIPGVSRYTLPIKCSGMKPVAWCEVFLGRHRPTFRQEFLRTAWPVHRQLEGVEGLQKWWATDNV